MMAAEGTVAMGIFTARKSTTGMSVMRTSASAKRAKGEQDGRPSTAIGAGDNVGRGQTFPGLCGRWLQHTQCCNYKYRKE